MNIHIILGCILVTQINYLNGVTHLKPEITICNNEIDLLDTFIQLVNNWDPEIICGYEVS